MSEAVERDELKIVYDRIGRIGRVIFAGEGAHIIQQTHDLIMKTYNSMIERSDDLDYSPVLIVFADNEVLYELGRLDGGRRLETNSNGHFEFMGFRVVRVLEPNHLSCMCVNPPDTNCQRVMGRPW